MEVSDKGGGRTFNRQNFKKKYPMFKYLTVGLETIVFSYGQLKDAAVFIKSNEAMSRYVGINSKSVVTMAARVVPSFTELDLKLPEDPDDTAGNFAFLKLETDFTAISKNKLTWEENRRNIFNLYLQHCTPNMRSKL